MINRYQYPSDVKSGLYTKGLRHDLYENYFKVHAECGSKMHEEDMSRIQKYTGISVEQKHMDYLELDLLCAFTYQVLMGKEEKNVPILVCDSFRDKKNTFNLVNSSSQKFRKYLNMADEIDLDLHVEPFDTQEECISTFESDFRTDVFDIQDTLNLLYIKNCNDSLSFDKQIRKFQNENDKLKKVKFVIVRYDNGV